MLENSRFQVNDLVVVLNHTFMGMLNTAEDNQMELSTQKPYNLLLSLLKGGSEGLSGKGLELLSSSVTQIPSAARPSSNVSAILGKHELRV